MSANIAKQQPLQLQGYHNQPQHSQQQPKEHDGVNQQYAQQQASSEEQLVSDVQKEAEESR